MAPDEKFWILLWNVFFLYHWLSSLNHYICNMLRAIEYRICPTEEPKVLLAGTSGCCRFAYKRALHMKITACKERKLPLVRGIAVWGLQKVQSRFPRQCTRPGSPATSRPPPASKADWWMQYHGRLETAQNNPSPMDFKLAGEMYSSRPEQVQGGGLYTCLARKNKNLWNQETLVLPLYGNFLFK